MGKNFVDKARELTKELEDWEKEKVLIIQRNQLKEDKVKIKGKKWSTSKILILFLFINCTIIEIFTGFVTIKAFELAAITLLPVDFTPLVTLIGAVVGEVISFAIYAIKSAKENCINGITYMTAQQQMENQQGEIPPQDSVISDDPTKIYTDIEKEK